MEKLTIETYKRFKSMMNIGEQNFLRQAEEIFKYRFANAPDDDIEEYYFQVLNEQIKEINDLQKFFKEKLEFFVLTDNQILMMAATNIIQNHF